MKKKLVSIAILFLALYTSDAAAQRISTIAGDTTIGDSGYGGPATAAHLSDIFGMAVDGSGNIYASDYGNGRILKISIDGIISVAGGAGGTGYTHAGGPATAATFNEPLGVGIGPDGSIYFCDARNSCVKKIDAAGMLSVVAGLDTSVFAYGFAGDGGSATAALLSNPVSVVFDNSGNSYIADGNNNRIRKISTGGIITTYAGGDSVYRDGVSATSTLLTVPGAMTIDVVSGSFGSPVIRKITPSGIITTIAGQGTSGTTVSGDGGPATAAAFDEIDGLAVNADGDLFLAQSYKNEIRKISSAGILTTICGTAVEGTDGDGGYADHAQLFFPTGVAIDNKGNLLIGEEKNIRMIQYAVATAIPAIAAKSNGLAIFPNPSTGSFILQLSSATNEQANVTIMNIAGQKVKELTAATNTNVNMSLDVPAGNYFVIATTATGRWMQQVAVH